jgi:hypothetical protein
MKKHIFALILALVSLTAPCLLLAFEGFSPFSDSGGNGVLVNGVPYSDIGSVLSTIGGVLPATDNNTLSGTSTTLAVTPASLKYATGSPTRVSTEAQLAAAIADAAKPSIIITTSFALAASRTVPVGQSITILPGVVLSRSGASSAHLTINGPFTGPGVCQCFTDNTTSSDWVVFGPGSLTESNAAWFGVTADNATDQTAKFTSFFKSLWYTGGTAVIPPNTDFYAVATGFVPVAHTGSRLKIMAYGAKLRYTDGYTEGGHSNVYLSGDGNITLEGLTIDGNRGAMTHEDDNYTACISAAPGVSGATLLNNYIYNCSGAGIYRPGEKARILDNHFYNVRLNSIDNGGNNYLVINGNYIQDSGNQAIDLDQAGTGLYAPQHCTVTNNTIRGWGKLGTANISAITLGGEETTAAYVDLAGWNIASNNNIEFVNYATGVDSYGISVGGKNCIVSGNVIRGATTYAIKIVPWAWNAEITGNLISEAVYGVQNSATSQNNKNLLISGNTMREVAVGALIYGVSDVAITNNSIISTVGQYGLWVMGLDHLTAEGNVINLSLTSSTVHYVYGIVATTLTNSRIANNSAVVTCSDPYGTFGLHFTTSDAYTEVINNHFEALTAAGHDVHLESFNGILSDNYLYHLHVAIEASGASTARGAGNVNFTTGKYILLDGNTTVDGGYVDEPIGRFTIIGAGAGGFAVDADGDVTAKSYTTTRTATEHQIQLYESTDHGGNSTTIKTVHNSTADNTITFGNQSLDFATGTYTGDDLCKYTASGTVISCNVGIDGNSTAVSGRPSYVDSDDNSSMVCNGYYTSHTKLVWPLPAHTPGCQVCVRQGSGHTNSIEIKGPAGAVLEPSTKAALCTVNQHIRVATGAVTDYVCVVASATANQWDTWGVSGTFACY